MLYFLCSCSCLVTFLLSSQFYWHIRLKSTAYFFDPPCILDDVWFCHCCCCWCSPCSRITSSVTSSVASSSVQRRWRHRCCSISTLIGGQVTSESRDVIAENRLVSCHNQSIVLYTHAACAVAAPQRNGRVSVRPSLCLTVLSIDRSTGGARFAAERPASSRYRRTAAGAVLQAPAFSGSNGAQRQVRRADAGR